MKNSTKALIFHNEFNPITIADIYYCYQAYLACNADKVIFSVPVDLNESEKERPYFLDKQTMIKKSLDEHKRSGYPLREHDRRVEFCSRCEVFPHENDNGDSFLEAVNFLHNQNLHCDIYILIRQSDLYKFGSSGRDIDLLEQYKFIIIPNLKESIEYTIFNNELLITNIDLCVANMLILLKIDRYLKVNAKDIRDNFHNHKNWVYQEVENYILNNKLYNVGGENK